VAGFGEATQGKGLRPKERSMTIASVQQSNAQLDALVDYLTKAGDGEMLSWERIEADTGVRCRNDTKGRRGRQLVGRALQKAKRPYETHRGVGVKMSSAESTPVIMQHKVEGVVRAVSRAGRTHKQLVTRHYDQLDDGAKRKMDAWGAFEGALRGAAQMGAKHFKLPKLDPADLPAEDPVLPSGG
jgi:hypothetical protein